MTKNQKPKLAALVTVALAAKRAKFPNVPTSALPRSTYEDSTANGLTRAVVDFLNLQKNCTAWRKGNAPTFDANIGRYRSNNVLKGVSDIQAIKSGNSMQIEIKAGKDRISEAQRNFAERIKAAGGLFIIARTFEGFVDEWAQLFPIEFDVPELAEIWRGAMATPAR